MKLLKKYTRAEIEYFASIQEAFSKSEPETFENMRMAAIGKHSKSSITAIKSNIDKAIRRAKQFNREEYKFFVLPYEDMDGLRDRLTRKESHYFSGSALP